VKNVCDNQGGFTCLGYLGQQDTKIELILVALTYPRWPSKVIRLDVYGTAGGYAKNVKNAPRVIYTSHILQKCL
jgi:hypothetical protein